MAIHFRAIHDTEIVAGILDKIASTSSRKEKEGLLTETPKLYGPNVVDLFKNVLQWALDPSITYGIYDGLSAYSHAEVGGRGFTSATFDLLRNLRTRLVTGNMALSAIEDEMGVLDKVSADLLYKILIKDLKAGIGASTVNKIFPNLIQEFPYMRCSLPKQANPEGWDWGLGHISQEKADGMFVNINIDALGAVSFHSRQGTSIPFKEMGDLLYCVRAAFSPNTQVHGELLVEKHGVVLPREIGNGIMNSVAQGGKLEEGYRVIAKVWDMIPLDMAVSKGAYAVPYKERFSDLGKLIIGALKGTDSALSLIDTKVVRSYAEAKAHAQMLMKQGKEGTILKNRDAIWEDKTSKGQVKLKLEVTVDLMIIEIVEGDQHGKNAGRPGSLTCISSDELLRVDVTVKNEKMREAIEANPHDWIGRVMSVTSNNVLEPSESNPLHSSLFLPRFAEDVYRTDKDEADSLRRVLDQFEAAVAA